MVSHITVVEGAYYAMEQAGRLINDAAALYQQRRWPIPSTRERGVAALPEISKHVSLCFVTALQ